MPGAPESLEELRRRVAELDAAIAASITERLDLARRIGAAKAVTHEPTRDYEVEARVMERWRDALGASGIPAGRAEAFARWLVEESVRVQHGVGSPAPASVSGAQEIAVVGGAGAMGRWLAEFFEDGGHRVSIVDPSAGADGRRTYPDVATAAASAQVVVFATPIRRTAPLLRQALTVRTNPLIFDVLSVKAPIAPVLKAAAREGRNVTSVHPMFGPSARTLSGRNLLVVSCGVPEADRAVRALFGGSALAVAELSLDRHDLLIAESLGLAHAVNLLFLASLASDPASPHELARSASTTFHRQSSLARTVAEEGAELYLDIQSSNPHSWGMYQELRQALERLSGIVERGDLAAFQELLREGTAKLEPGSEPMRT